MARIMREREGKRRGETLKRKNKEKGRGVRGRRGEIPGAGRVERRKGRTKCPRKTKRKDRDPRDRRKPASFLRDAFRLERTVLGPSLSLPLDTTYYVLSSPAHKAPEPSLPHVQGRDGGGGRPRGESMAVSL